MLCLASDLSRIRSHICSAGKALLVFSSAGNALLVHLHEELTGIKHLLQCCETISHNGFR
jgi:hypothetical protein